MSASVWCYSYLVLTRLWRANGSVVLSIHPPTTVLITLFHVSLCVNLSFALHPLRYFLIVSSIQYPINDAHLRIHREQAFYIFIVSHRVHIVTSSGTCTIFRNPFMNLLPLCPKHRRSVTLEACAFVGNQWWILEQLLPSGRHSLPNFERYPSRSRNIATSLSRNTETKTLCLVVKASVCFPCKSHNLAKAQALVSGPSSCYLYTL